MSKTRREKRGSKRRRGRGGPRTHGNTKNIWVPPTNGGGGVRKLKGDQNRKGRSKNIREYQEHMGRGGGGVSKTEDS